MCGEGRENYLFVWFPHTVDLEAKEEMKRVTIGARSTWKVRLQILIKWKMDKTPHSTETTLFFLPNDELYIQYNIVL